MPPPRKLLALVASRADHGPGLERAAHSAGYELQVTDNSAAVSVSLRQATPTALLVDATARGAEQLCQKVRFGQFPRDICLLVGAHKITDAAFAKAVQWGADDVISLGFERALTERLSRLPDESALPPPRRGAAVVADPDALRVARMARVLGHAGYEVEVATELDPALNLAFSESANLVVISGEFGRPRELVTLAREGGSRACFIFLVEPAAMPEQHQATRNLEKTSIVSSAEPPEACLFVSNELLAAAKDHHRSESRLFYGTVVAFRSAGSEEDDFGFTYNVSPHGLYVRTLAAPEDPHLWLELRPPGSERRVRLAGEIVWRRGFGLLSTATAPPGFGVRIAGGLCSDHDLWVEGCRVLPGEQQAASHPASPTRSAARAGPVKTQSERPSEPPSERITVADLVESTLTDHDLPRTVGQVVQQSAAVPLDPIALTDFVAPSLGLVDTRPSERPSARPAERATSKPPGSRVAKKQDREAPARRPSAAPPQAAAVVESARAPQRAVLTVGLVLILALAAILTVVLHFGDDLVAGGSNVPSRRLPSNSPRAQSRPIQRKGADGPGVSRPISPRVSATLPADPSPSGSNLQANPAPLEGHPSAVSPPVPSADGSKLPLRRGYLWVISHAAGTVYVNGVPTGNTNSLLEVPCGWRFIRLGSEPGPRWLAPGHTVDVACQGFTRVTIEPEGVP